MSVIHVLDEVTANQIAAGEVVERPVNAVKELVENAVDASASEIEVEIADGGISYIRVTDNVCGMTPEDARLSIVRHATSKIRSVENIYHIASLGFRGEALPSIMSVSKGRITTRRHDEDMGTVLEIEGGEVQSVEPCGAPAGTTVEVRDLFYNVPARKKFLKSERTESSRINSMVGKMALANPNVAFRLINNGRTVIETPGNGRLIDAISALYGLKTAGEMLPAGEQADEMILEGMIGKPSLLKSNRSGQTIIVNRRVVDNAAVSKAVDNAYHSLLPKNGHPVYVLSFTVPPESIDVNVHPQKREIKFADEQTLFRLTYHAVLTGLTSATRAEDISTEMIKNPGHDIMDTNPVQIKGSGTVSEDTDDSVAGDSGYSSSLQPSYSQASEGHAVYPDHFWHGSSSGNDRTEYTPVIDPSEVMNTHFARREEPAVESQALFEIPDEEERQEQGIPLGQIAECFIVCCHGKDLYIIDQHAAHERVRYDKLAERAEGIPMQEMLVPILVHAEETDMDILQERKDELLRLGIAFEQAGPDVIRIIGAPGDLPGEDMERVIRDALVAYHEKDIPSPETLRHRVMAFAACRGAIKRGDPLNIRQMKELINDLFKTSRPFVCPHGRPTIVRFTPGELGRLFHRP